MKRFYRISVLRDLFGRTLLVREWGRIGRTSRRLSQEMANLREARGHAGRLAVRKQRRGYVPVVD